MTSFRLARPGDAAALKRLYDLTGQRPVGVGMWADEKALAAQLSSPRRLWAVAEDGRGIKAVATITLEPDNRLAKLYRLFTLETWEERRALLTGCLSLAMKTVLERRLADVAYCTTRTINSADQLLALEHGFKAIGIFPNAPSADGRKVSGLAAWYAPDIIGRRYDGYPLHPAARPFFELARAQLGFGDLPRAARPAVPDTAPPPPPLEVVQAPAFAAERFRQLKERSKLSVNFYPFQTPNALITSPDQSVEVFAAVPPELRFAALIGEHLSSSVHPVALYSAVAGLLRQTGAAYIEVINDAADALGIECILQAGFVPCGYFPALKSADELRRDFVVFARSLEPVDAAPSSMPDAFAGFLDEFLRAQAGSRSAVAA